MNKQLTKRSIYYYGKDKDIFKKKNPSIYITHSSFFRKKLLHNKKRVFTKITRAFQFIGHNKHKKFRVYLHVNNPSYYNIEQIHNRCVQRKCSLFIISTGNPFPLFKLKKIKHILVSFSNTDESINQLTNIVCGKTKPKSKTNIALK